MKDEISTSRLAAASLRIRPAFGIESGRSEGKRESQRLLRLPGPLGPTPTCD